MKSEELVKAAELISSESKGDIVRGLAVATSIEKESLEFYSKQAEKAKNPELKKFWLFLAGEEKAHLNAIGELKEAVQAKGKFILYSFPNQDFHPFTEKDWGKGEESAFSAVLFALWKEEQARQFYLKAAEGIRDKNGKKFFEALAEFEHSHAKWLGEYVEESYYSHELIMG